MKCFVAETDAHIEEDEITPCLPRSARGSAPTAYLALRNGVAEIVIAELTIIRHDALFAVSEHAVFRHLD